LLVVSAWILSGWWQVRWFDERGNFVAVVEGCFGVGNDEVWLEQRKNFLSQAEATIAYMKLLEVEYEGGSPSDPWLQSSQTVREGLKHQSDDLRSGLHVNRVPLTMHWWINWHLGDGPYFWTPLWMLGVIALIPAAAAWHDDVRAACRARAARCVTCGYSLEKLPSSKAVCPECGAARQKG